MATVDTAIRDLFKEQLQAVQERQERQDERFNGIDGLLKEVQEQLQAKTAEAQQLRDDLEKQKQELEAISGRTKVLEDHDLESIKARLERLNSDPEGTGGLLQVIQRTEEMQKEVQQMIPKVEENTRLSHASKTRTDEFAEALRGYDRRREDLDKLSKETQERLEAVEKQSSSVSEKQTGLEASVAMKYERLWQEVLDHIEKLETERSNAIAGAGAGSKKGSTKDTQSLVNYALKFVAEGHEQRKSQEWRKMLVNAWKEQTWLAARRHMGIRVLHNLFRRKQRTATQRWHHQVAVSHLREQIVEEYAQKLNPVQAHASELAQKLEENCKAWQDRFSSLGDEKASSVHVDEKLAAHAGTVEEKMKALETMQTQLSKHAKQLEDLLSNLETHGQKHTTHDERISEVKNHSETLKQELEEFAKATEVQGMLKDLMLLWNLVKQLDAAKGDKKEVDALAVENANILSKLERRVEGIKDDLSGRVQEEATRTQEKWSQLDAKIEGSAKQMQQWEKMWEKMDGVMEDVMKKITAVQQQNSEVSRMGPGGLRKALSRELSVPRKEVPLLPHSKSTDLPFDGKDLTAPAPHRQQAPLASPALAPAPVLANGCKKDVEDTLLNRGVGSQGLTDRPRAKLVPGRPRSAMSARR